MTKQMLRKEMPEYVDFDYLSLKECAKLISDLVEKYGEDAQAEIEEGYLRVFVKVEETDEQYNYRKANEQQSLLYRKKQYEALKKEFEG